MTFSDLKCLGQERPLCVTNRLYFSWQCNEDIHSDFIITIFKEKEQIVSYDCKSTNRHIEVFYYNFEPLTEYFWNIKAFCDEKECISETKSFFTAIKDFGNAKWINDGSKFVELQDKVGSPALYLEKDFTVENLEKHYIATICGLGLHELYVNDKKVDDRVLEPAFSTYQKRAYASVYDIKPFIKKGKNHILVVLGDGWYNQTTMDTWGFYYAPWRDCCKMIFRLDTPTFSVVSDKSWTFKYGKILSNAIRCGERQDFTFSENEAKKYNVQIAVPVGGKIEFSYIPPIKECDSLQNQNCEKKGAGYLFDFGKNISGYISASFIGKKGSKVSIQYSDRFTNGELDNTTNSMFIFNKDLKYQTDELILSGNVDYFKPSFVYHGFRYVYIKSVDSNVQIKNITAHFVHTDLQRIGSFKTDNEILNNLYNMSIQAILSNYVGFPTDCPQREKNGWTGDAQLSLDCCIYNFDMAECYNKWLDDIIDSFRPSGQVSAICPTGGWGYNWGSGPAWDIAFFRISEALVFHYGYKHVANKVLPYMIQYLNYASGFEDADGLVEFGLGDWNYPKKISFPICPTKLTDSCYLMQMYEIIAELKLSVNENANYWLKKSRCIYKAVYDKFKDEKSLTGLAVLGYYNFRDTSIEIKEYLEKNNYEIHAGIIGTKFLLEVLGRANDIETAVKLLTKTDYPSFGYWVKNGQTALCEDFELGYSLNHHMYSSVAEFMMKYVAGIRFDKDYSYAVIRPTNLKNIIFIDCAVITPFGKLVIKKEENNVIISVPKGFECYYQQKDEKNRLKNGDNLVKL